MNGILKNYKECRLSIVIAVIALGLLVLIHEGGHFLAARICKVSVLKFSIGFGPRIFSFVKGETEYALSLIPLGGYVKMKGENPDQNEIHGDQDEFQSKKWYQRAFIAFAGPFSFICPDVARTHYGIGTGIHVVSPADLWNAK